MKTPVTITMLIVGALLILAPFVFGSIQDRQVSALLMARNDLNRVNFDIERSSLTPWSRFGCWFVGTTLCVVATIGATTDARRSAEASARLPRFASEAGN